MDPLDSKITQQMAGALLWMALRARQYFVPGVANAAPKHGAGACCALFRHHSLTLPKEQVRSLLALHICMTACGGHVAGWLAGRPA